MKSSINSTTKRAALFCVLLIIAACQVRAGQSGIEQRVTDLEAAIWSGNDAQARTILSAGDIPPETSENLCWLHFAIGLDRYRLIAPLIQAGVPADCKYVGMTPLQFAVSNNRYKAAEALINSGADVNAGIDDSDSTPPIIHAVQEYVARRVRGQEAGEAEHLVRLLLQNGADPNVLEKPDAPSKLCIAAEQGQAEMVRLLIDSGARVNQVTDQDPNTPGVTALECALLRKHSNIETVQALLYAGADPAAGPHADELLENAKQNLPNAIPLLKQYGAK